jgi:DNA-binding response OmpR family regulator
MKILLVEADSDMQDVLAYALRREGHAVATAKTGPLAVAQTCVLRPDVILICARELALSNLDPADLVVEDRAPDIVSYEFRIPFGLEDLLTRLRSLTPQ